MHEPEQKRGREESEKLRHQSDSFVARTGLKDVDGKIQDTKGKRVVINLDVGLVERKQSSTVAPAKFFRSACVNVPARITANPRRDRAGR
jgi:hypothetical protein